MTLGDTTQLPQGILESFAQALKTLREADRGPLPIGVGQYEVIRQMLERLATNGHPQTANMGKVRCAQATRLMDLPKVHFLVRSLGRTPHLHAALKRAELTILKSARIPTLKPF